MAVSDTSFSQLSGEAGTQSPLHRLDARVKIVVAIVWAFLLASLNSLTAGAAALACSLLLLLNASLPWAIMARRLLTANFFIAFMWLMLPFSFSSPGQVLTAIGHLEVTREGLQTAALLTLKANAILIGIMALLSTSPIFVLAVAGLRLGAPEMLMNLILLAVRYFYVMFQEYQILRIAMRARGFKASLNKNTLSGLANLVGSLLVRSFDRAERVHRAMLCRGYNGVIWVRAEFGFGRGEIIFILLMLVMTLTVGGLEWLPNV